MCERICRINFYFLFLVSGIFVAFSTKAQQNPEVKAIQYFNSGNYNESEKIFQKLLEQNPEDPMLNYYYGASRTENGHFGDQELTCLAKAEKQFTPERLYYYLGIQHHARQNWDRALKYYNQFRLSIPEKEQNALELNKKIQLCFNQSNLFIVTPENAHADTTGYASLDNNAIIPSEMEDRMDLTASAETIFDFNPDENLSVPRQALPDLPGIQASMPSGEQVHFQVDDFITYFYTSQFQTDEGLQIFEKGMKLQVEQENKLQEADRLRAEYKEIKASKEKEEIASEIMKLEYESYQLEEEINYAFSNSREIEKAYWDNAGTVSRKNFLLEQEKIMAQLEEENHDHSENREILLIELPVPKPVNAGKTTPPELVYKIQIGAYSKGIPSYKQRLFNKLSVIRTIENYTDEKGVVVYTTGNLASFEDALKMQNQVRQEGIQDAKVVPYIDGKRITLEQAKQIEAKNDI